jgi:hypothetical protein
MEEIKMHIKLNSRGDRDLSLNARRMPEQISKGDHVRLGQKPVLGSCNHGDGLWDPIKREEFLDHLSDYQLFKGSCVPLS